MDLAGWLLAPLAVLYRGAIAVRNLYYDRAPGAVRPAGVPVISVGNLTVGGTGKTPMVIEIARRLRDAGRRPAVLTRGYRGRAAGEADEVRELRAALPDVPVLVDPDRVAGAAAARRLHAADCLVLDDGFQHRRLARDLDIVLVDALRPWGGGRLLPAGRLREPPASLGRAGLVVITRANQAEPAAVARISAEIARRAPGVPVAEAAVRADALVGQGGEQLPPETLAGQRVLAVCGLGNPQTFERLVAGLGADTCAVLNFADHQHYGRRELDRICAAAGAARAGLVVTTRKDWVKLAPLWAAGAPRLVRLEVRIDLRDGSAVLDALLRQALEGRR